MDGKLSRRSFALGLGTLGALSFTGGAATYGAFTDEETASGVITAANNFSYPFGLNLGRNTPASYEASFGTTFVGDRQPDAGSSTIRFNNQSIGGTADPTLYRSYRYGSDFSYDISVDDGTYQVLLYFAERYWQADGQRVFDVLVDGNEVISNLDIHSRVGHNTALVETIPDRSPTGDTITVDFSATDAQDVDNAIISAIELAHWPLRQVTSRSHIEHSGKVAEVENSSTADGANVVQHGYDGNPNQQWTPMQNDDGTYRFVNENSGKVFAVAGAGTVEGDSVVQQSWNGADHQRWDIVDNGDDTYRLVNVNSGLVADVANISAADGANVIQWSWNGGDNQRWSFPAI